MSRKLEDISNYFIQTIGDISASIGLSRTSGQLYGLLFLSKNALSLDIMAKRLGVSKGSISLNIRSLEEWGAVRKVWVKGSRKDFYEAELDTLNILTKRAKIAVKKRLYNTMSGLKRYKEKVEKIDEKDMTPEEVSLVSLYKDRFKMIENMQKTVASLLDDFSDDLFV